MIIGIGLDLVDIDRLRRALNRNASRFEKRVFTETERRQSAAASDPERSLAARFAIKEACLKALGWGLGSAVSFVDIDVALEGHSAAAVTLRSAAATRAEQLGVRHVHAAVSIRDNTAAGIVVLEGRR